MWRFIFNVALLFGIPALLIVAALAAFYRSCQKTDREARDSADPERLHKQKIKKIFLTIAIVIGSVFVIGLVVMAILLTTAVAFM